MFEEMFRLLKLSSVTYSNSAATRNFKEIISIVHPDKNSSPEAAIVASAVIYAYEVLKDTKKREYYKVYGQPDIIEPYDNTEASKNVVLMNRLLTLHSVQQEQEKQRLARERSRQEREDETIESETTEAPKNKTKDPFESFLEQCRQAAQSTSNQECKASCSPDSGIDQQATPESENQCQNDDKTPQPDQQTDNNEEPSQQVEVNQEEIIADENHEENPDEESASTDRSEEVEEENEVEIEEEYIGEDPAETSFQPQPGPSSSTPRTTRPRVYPEVIIIDSDSDSELDQHPSRNPEMRRYFNLDTEPNGLGTPPPTYEEAMNSDPVFYEYYEEQEQQEEEEQADASTSPIRTGTTDTSCSPIRTELIDTACSPIRTETTDTACSPIKPSTRDFGTSPIKFEDQPTSCICGSTRRNLTECFNTSQTNPQNNERNDTNNQTGQSINESGPSNNTTSYSDSFINAGRSASFEGQTEYKQYIIKLTALRTRNGVSKFQAMWGPSETLVWEPASLVISERKALKNWLLERQLKHPRSWHSLQKEHPEFFAVLKD